MVKKKHIKCDLAVLTTAARILFSVFLGLLLGACNKESICFTSSGSDVSYTIDLDPFDSLYVFRGINLELKMGETFKAEVKTKSNLQDFISVISKNNVLELRDNTSCNFVRPFGETTVTVEAPNIILIRSFTEQDIRSLDTLTYPDFRLVANANRNGAGTGDIFVQVNVNRLALESNTVTRFYLSGTADFIYVGFFGSIPIIHGENLSVNRFQFFHRSAGNITINPIESIIGDIYGTGNIISLNQPPLVDVRAFNSGQLIFP
ncbi:MAG: GIN domain-containing protein [Luteibaculaceae bacterium]